MKRKILISLLGLCVFLASRCIASDTGGARPDLAFTAFFQRTNGWIAGDGALSVPLSDGKVLWLFGDSHIDDLDPVSGTTPCLFQARNAALVQDKKDSNNTRTLVGRGPGFRSWLKNSTNSNEWFWPVCGLQSGKTVYVYLSSLQTTPQGGMWGFKGTGRDCWATLQLPALEPVSYVSLPAFNGISFGNGFVTEGEFTYAFGGKQDGMASDVYVARFKSNQPEQDWRFWDGRDWAESATNAYKISRGASTSFHVCKISGKYILTSSEFSVACDQGREIYVANAERPTGPYSKRRKIYRIDDEYQGHHPFFYFPVMHPEFQNSAQELLLTYSINNYEPCVPGCVRGRSNPDHYRPKAVRIPLSLALGEER